MISGSYLKHGAGKLSLGKFAFAVDFITYNLCNYKTSLLSSTCMEEK